MSPIEPERRADELLEQVGADELRDMELSLIEEDAPLTEQVAVKLARSKTVINARQGPLHVSVVFAMYLEHERILRPDQHPLGEDFVNRKVSQLRWLFGDRDVWDLVMVDDGCPRGSGHIAREMIREEGHDRVARVLFLEDAIGSGHPVLSDLTTPDQSRKGGAIELGMYEAARDPVPGHIIVYTDADLSTHLGQVGLLADAIDNGADCAAGSRRETTSVLVKGGARNDRGKLFIYLWKQMLPQLRDIIDSQCGFKAFRGHLAQDLVHDTIEKKFAFDIELLLRSELNRPGSITRVPVAWIDSEAGSTTADLDPYLPMLQAIAGMYSRYSPPDPRAESFANVIEDMDQGSWETLLTAIPEAITDREPLEYSTWAEVDASEIARAATSGSTA